MDIIRIPCENNDDDVINVLAGFWSKNRSVERSDNVLRLVPVSDQPSVGTTVFPAPAAILGHGMIVLFWYFPGPYLHRRNHIADRVHTYAHTHAHAIQTLCNRNEHCASAFVTVVSPLNCCADFPPFFILFALVRSGYGERFTRHSFFFSQSVGDETSYADRWIYFADKDYASDSRFISGKTSPLTTMSEPAKGWVRSFVSLFAYKKNNRIKWMHNVWIKK